MSKLFAVTGQNNRRNAGKRAVDTEILLRESQSQPRDSDRYASAVARMNYLYVGHICKSILPHCEVNCSHSFRLLICCRSAMLATAAPTKLPIMIFSIP